MSQSLPLPRVGNFSESILDGVILGTSASQFSEFHGDTEI